MSKREHESDLESLKRQKVAQRGVSRFVEWDMMTTDLKKSVDFYSALFPDWTFEENGMGDIARIAKVNGAVIGGFVKEDVLPKCHWMPYIGVENIDAALEHVKAQNGKICFDPVKLPHGKFTVVDDVAGAHVSLIQLDEKDYEVEPFQIHYPCFNELYCADVNAVKDFYKAVADWDMVPPNEKGWAPFTYGDAADRRAAAMKFPSPEMQQPEWSTYFHVKDLEASAAKVKELGGLILCPVMDIPEGKFCFCADVMGAQFALFQSNWEFLKKDFKPPVVPRLSHITVLVNDVEKAKVEYIDKLGFDLELASTSPDGTYNWLSLRRPGDKQFAFTLMKPEAGEENLVGHQTNGTPLAIIQTPEVDKDIEEMRKKGVKVEDPKDTPWGREGYFYDSNGTKYSIITPKFPDATRKGWIMTYYVEDQDKAQRFLADKLGWVVSMDKSDFGMRWLTMKPCYESSAELTVMTPQTDADKGQVGKQSGSRPLFIVDVVDVFATYAQCVEKGIEITQQPKEQPWGTEMVIQDPFGTKFCIITPKPFPPKKERVAKLSHVTVLVSDQEKAKAEYTEKLGFELVMDGHTPDGKMRWITVRRPDDKDFEFALMKPEAGDEKLVGHQTTGTPLAIIQTGEVDKDIEEMRKKGVKVEDPKDAPWGREAYFYDSDGTKYSLMTPRQPGVARKGWIMTYYVDDQEKAHHFLADKLGWVVSMDTSDYGMRWLTMKPSKDSFTELTILAAGEENKGHVGNQSGSIPLFVIDVPDVFGVYAECDAQKVEIVEKPKEQPWGTEFVIKDPFGNKFCITTAKH